MLVNQTHISHVNIACLTHIPEKKKRLRADANLFHIRIEWH